MVNSGWEKTFRKEEVAFTSVREENPVCKDPPYKVEESGYAGFILPIEVYFKNKEEPKKVRFDYDLFLHLEGHPPVNHLRCEKLTFNNPTEEFRRKLLKAGGVCDAGLVKSLPIEN
ncbi:hypothetical protein J1605_001265 [Eschrichtius robustus]|uniref:YEATS domain-containing protein n=1 Tax=Eschrichtius robustus TaxID=9764 RepID=A0AB34GAA7_ESCRO|nr:hypothetical protein J1605_001265 [Eschrichtius robustus]